MQIVIDINEKDYENIMNEDTNNLVWGERAIKNGTPLPKGHGRIIDAEVFAHNVVKYSHQSTKTIGQALADTPSIVEADKGDTE